jgi:hydroxymethylpyrimidine/phosphomethylpyrimidine kinase
MMIKPNVLTIAGSDPSGGAGIQADIKAISATGSYAAAVITALTAQNTQGVQAIYSIPADFVAKQIDSIFSDLSIAAVKIGMLHQKEIIDVVKSALDKYKPTIVVIDPVMSAKDGSPLLETTLVNYLKDNLFSYATLLTPNLPEAELILNKKIMTHAEMETAAQEIAQQFNINVLLKGGHLQTEKAKDILYLLSTQQATWFENNYINTIHTHGTGCTLSSAIASYLAQNYPLPEAIQKAKNYLTQAIQAGMQLKVGKGRGPVDHFYEVET